MQPEQPIQPAYTPSSFQPASGRFSRKQKLLIYTVGIFGGLIILLMVASSIFGGKESPTQVSLNTVYARNIQILNLLDEFGSELRSADGASYVSRATLLITSDNLSLASYANASNKSGNSLSNYATISAELEKAISRSDFDEFFMATTDYEIAANKALLEGLDSSSLGANLEPIVTTAITNYDSLLN